MPPEMILGFAPFSNLCIREQMSAMNPAMLSGSSLQMRLPREGGLLGKLAVIIGIPLSTKILGGKMKTRGK